MHLTWQWKIYINNTNKFISHAEREVNFLQKVSQTLTEQQRTHI